MADTADLPNRLGRSAPAQPSQLVQTARFGVGEISKRRWSWCATGGPCHVPTVFYRHAPSPVFDNGAMGRRAVLHDEATRRVPA
jgi:hypothetical protein